MDTTASNYSVQPTEPEPGTPLDPNDHPATNHQISPSIRKLGTSDLRLKMRGDSDQSQMHSDMAYSSALDWNVRNQ